MAYAWKQLSRSETWLVLTTVRADHMAMARQVEMARGPAVLEEQAERLATVQDGAGEVRS